MQVYDLDTNIDVIKHHGSTDPLILVGILMHHGIAKEEVRGRTHCVLPLALLITEISHSIVACQTACASARYSCRRFENNT